MDTHTVKILCPKCKSETVIVDHMNSWKNYVCIRYGFGCDYCAAVDENRRKRLEELEPIKIKIE